MSKHYRHRVGVRAEISFDLVLGAPNPTPEELRDAIVAILNRTTDEEGGFSFPNLADGRILPAWASVDRQVNPSQSLDIGDVISYDCMELRHLQ